jgi:hypothetical protein
LEGLAQAGECDLSAVDGWLTLDSLIAIMLGRLKMSVADCINSYKELMKTVFVNKAPFFSMNLFKTTFFDQGYFYDSAPLESAIKKVIKKAEQDPEVLLNDPKNTSACKVSVKTMPWRRSAIC